MWPYRPEARRKVTLPCGLSAFKKLDFIFIKYIVVSNLYTNNLGVKMDAEETVLVLLNRHGSKPMPCSNLLVQAACLSDEINCEARRKKDQLRSLGYSEKLIQEIVDLHSHRTVQTTLDLLEKKGLIVGRQNEQKLLRDIEHLNLKILPSVMEQLRINLLSYKLTKNGLQKLWEKAARTQGSDH